MRSWNSLVIGLVAAAVAVLAFLSAPVVAQPPLGKSQQPLVLGETVPAAEQERRGLVSLNGGGGCGGTLLRNDWVLTAAHCVEDAAGALLPPDGITARAVWGVGGAQRRTSRELITFRPVDIALVHLERPFVINGSTTGVVGRSLDTRGVYASEIGQELVIYGRGINAFARQSPVAGGRDIPSASDGLYRKGTLPLFKVYHGVLSVYGGRVKGAGGDSGGPIIRVGSDEIIGVASACQTVCLAGHGCGDTTVPPDGRWDWVAETKECKYVSVHPFVARFTQVMNSRRVLDAPSMTVTRGANGVTYTRPVIRAENGARLRLDYCREWGANCGQAAANAFCAAQDPAKPIAASAPKANDVGPTAIISTGQICRGGDCDSFKSIRCGSPLRPPVDRVREPPSVIGGG